MARPARYRYRAEIYKVLKGDVFKARIDLGLHISHDVKVRLAGVDCGDCTKALAYAEENFKDRPVDIQTLRKLRDTWLITMWVEGVHINSYLVDQGLGKAFNPS